MKAFIFSCEALSLRTVQIQALSGIRNPRGVEDYDVTAWMSYPLKGMELVVCLEDYRKKIDRIPLESCIALPNSFIFCWEKEVCFLCVNIEDMRGDKI